MNNKSHDISLFSIASVKRQIPMAFKKMHFKYTIKQPIIFISELAFLLDFVYLLTDFTLFTFLVCLFLFLTVFFSTLSESIAEVKGKGHVESLKKLRVDIQVKKIINYSELDSFENIKYKECGIDDIKIGDYVYIDVDDIVPVDGDIVKGIASFDESAVTGESAPVIREAGSDGCSVIGGTKVISDQIVVEVAKNPGEGFIDRMIDLVDGSKRQKTPNEIALNIVLSSVSAILLISVGSIIPVFNLYKIDINITIVTALIVSLLPTTICGLVSAIGISGINRLLKRNVVASSGKAIEAAGDVNLLFLDKTGTITLGNRSADRFIPSDDSISMDRLAKYAYLSSLSDTTPEGRSIVSLAKRKYSIKIDDNVMFSSMNFIKFSAATRLSGVDFNDGSSIRKGASAAIYSYINKIDPSYKINESIYEIVHSVSVVGGTPLVLVYISPANKVEILGTISLKDTLKNDIQQKFATLRRMGIKTVMVTGDNEVTASAIAKEAEVDDFLANATPEDKVNTIKSYQKEGRLVAMSGDGTNDAPALAQADVAVCMNSGTSAAKDASNLIDLDSNPTKLIDIVYAGKSLLMTRGVLTTFSIANDLSKYFAIIPLLLSAKFTRMGIFNIIHLHSIQSAVLSSMIFNALIIIALVPMALKGVKYKPSSADNILRQNLFIYGIGGLIFPFICIKGIDLLVQFLF